MMAIDTDLAWRQTEAAIERVRAAGVELGLPFVAAQSDLADPEPMHGRDGRPYAETHFAWIDPDDRYWQNRRLALHAPFLHAVRLISEPCYFAEGRLGSWRETGLLDPIDCSAVTQATGIAAAIIAPVHLPRAIVGAVVWAAREPLPVADIFAAHAARLHMLALQLVASHAEASARLAAGQPAVALTRREVQCLRWAAAGKTDGEIGIILDLSVSTVRFHLHNAGAKLGTNGRAQTVQAAAGLGFVSPP
jgi:DNA-binding CsgD family transcriptional regulator